MCGIAGFIDPGPVAGSDAILERMMDAIRHRGPDDSGVYTHGPAWLGHRRLSIVDLTGGRQPMLSADESLCIVYNGEVFNHASIRPELEKLGATYRTRSDTETILHAYGHDGARCVDRFRGMFAFAIWDRNHQTLFCARDRLGIKPFYYYWDGRRFIFASEIKAILRHPAVSANVETELLPEYLSFGYVSEERTLFRNIRKLMPGHTLTVRAGDRPSIDIRSYWDVPEPGGERMTDSEWIEETRRRLEETVRMRLMSDVPLGMFLSGGVDSSAIAAIMSRMVDQPVKTFSVGYAEAQFSELNYAAEVSRHIGTDHHEIRVGMQDFFDELPRLIWHEDEPITWPSSVSLYFVSRLASEQVKVVLTGEGSDELFGGYERYQWNLLNEQALKAYRLIPRFTRDWIRRSVATSHLLRASLRRKLRHTFIGREDCIESLYLDNFYGAFSLAEQTRLLPSPPSAVYGNYIRYWQHYQDASSLARMLYADQKTYLIELLMKQDQMSMASSIESRVPLLDHTLVEFAMRLPDRMKIRGRIRKYVLKKSVEDLLPPEIIYRKKMGFPTPLRKWLLDGGAAPLYESLSCGNGIVGEYLNMTEVRSLIKRHRSGFEDATDRIWRLLNLQIWGEIFLRGRPIESLRLTTPRQVLARAL